MPLSNNSRVMMEEILKRTKAALETVRKVNITERLNIYSDNWKSILATEVARQFSEKTAGNIAQMIDDSSNVLKRIINEISIVYQKDAKRIYIQGEGDNQKENERYKELLSEIPTNLIMQETNRMTNLCNECLIYIVPRNNRIEYDILTPDIVEVVQNENDPTKADAICFTQSYVDTLGNTKIYYIYWDVYGTHLKFDEDFEPVYIEGNEDGKNPYIDPDNKDKTILPFVIFHKNYPKCSVWDSTSGEDLVSATKIIGVLMTYLNYLLKVSSYKIFYMAGISKQDLPDKIVLDPLHPKIIKDPNGKVGVVDMQGDLKTIWEIIVNKIGVIANNYGLSLDNFKLTLSAQSGFALKIKNSGLQKIVESQIKFYRYYENELFEKTVIINNNQYKKNKIDEKGTFIIDFAEIEIPEDPEEVRKQWTFDLKIGAKSIFDYIRFINPDIKTDEEAEKMLAKNVEINNRVQTDYGISVDNLINQAISEQPLINI